MFNKNIYIGLFNGILVCSVFFISGCTEQKYNNNKIITQPINTSVPLTNVKIAEYIIVLNDDVSISQALNSLKMYNVHQISDLKRNRYLVGLKNDPGIGKLQKDILGSKYIKHIQPNFIYKIQ